MSSQCHIENHNVVRATDRVRTISQIGTLRCLWDTTWAIEQERLHSVNYWEESNHCKCDPLWTLSTMQSAKPKHSFKNIQSIKNEWQLKSTSHQALWFASYNVLWIFVEPQIDRSSDTSHTNYIYSIENNMNERIIEFNTSANFTILDLFIRVST